MIGRTLSHYLIEQRLGAGGMGTVYLARDLALGRPAAVKVVTDALDDSLRQWLLREAEASARLQHPAIATFYESGERDGIAFIAMEYVRGHTLRERLGRGALPTREVLAIGAALLEALNHAHAAGILHRDIKPENVMLADSGTPKLLDFGVARVAHEAAGQSATATNLSGGRILGTVGYMAPEQLRGEPVDVRADVFALGAVLYEMVSGRPAFPGSSATQRVAAILSASPAPLAPGLPHGLNDILRRALAKDPNDRYPSAAALLSDLRGLAAGDDPTPLPQTLAVLDLRNLSGRPEDAWLGSGIAESLTTDLARVPGLTVVARPRVIQTVRQASAASGDAPDALEIGSLLGCRWMLSGGYQCLGSLVRITTALTEVGTGQIAAAEKLDGPIEDIFNMQDRLSKAVVGSLNLRLPTPALRPAADRDIEAFEYYARGRRFWQRLEKGTFDQAGDLYRKAIAIEPTHAMALTGLAGLHAMRFTFTTDPGDLEQATNYARRAIASDPRLGEPHVWLGYVLWRQKRMDEAAEEERLAGDLEPDSVYPFYFGGCVQLFSGQPSAAVPLLQRAVKQEPLAAFAWIALANAHLSLGHLDEARWCLERAVTVEKMPSPAAWIGAGAYLADCLRISTQLAEARQVCLAALEAIEGSDHMYRDTFRGVALCVLGRIALDQGDTEAARAALHQLIAHIGGRERTLGGGFLVIQAMAELARAGEGREWLAKARRLYQERTRLNFCDLWSCSDEATLLELGRAALSMGDEDAVELLIRARDAGSFEAKLLLQRIPPEAIAERTGGPRSSAS